MEISKKILSLLLAVIMIVSTVPMAFAQGNTYKVGDIIQFGSYPQSKVTNSATISALNELAPDWENWRKYWYYSGDNNYGSMEPGDWMRYTDITYNDNKYRGVKFTEYRPGFTYYNYLKEQKANGYSTDTVYWFKFESIDWRVLDPATGLVMCETIIDAQPYSNTLYDRGVGSGHLRMFNSDLYVNYACDYETSSIRWWLNSHFYYTAFTDSEKKEIGATTLNNDSFYKSSTISGYVAPDGDRTTDKIFLLSYDDVRNSDYGFSDELFDTDKARRAKGSDYAQSQGLSVYRTAVNAYNGKSNWILRNPGWSTLYCCLVDSTGEFDTECEVADTRQGIRPALRFNQISDIGKPEHQHSYSSVTTNPTCNAQGYTTYACPCGDTYVSNYADVVAHRDYNTDYKCDFGCGYEFEKPAPEKDPDTPNTPNEPEEELNFFQKIIQWFKNLFAKLFGWMK